LERDEEPKPAEVQKGPGGQPPAAEKPAAENPAKEARQGEDGAADVAMNEGMLEAMDQQVDFNIVLFDAADEVAGDEMEGSDVLRERMELLIIALNRLMKPAVEWLFPNMNGDEPEVAIAVAEQAVDEQGAEFVVRVSDEEPAEEEEDDLTPQQRAIARANADFEIGVENFENWIFSNVGGRSKSVNRIDDQMRLIIDSLQQLFGLSEQQRQRLELSGKGDIARFEQQVEQTRARFMEVRKDQERFNHIWNDIGPLQQKMQAPFFDDQSLLIKSIIGLLSGDQLEKYRDWQVERRRFHYQAKIELIVAEVEMYAPLTTEQRRKIVQLIAESGPPPKKRGQFDQVYVMYQMSVAPDDKWLAIIDKRQFDVFNKLRQQGRQYGQMLRQNGVVE
ncbi:MAG: hypothetical protein ACKO38_04850, partial [Planctomycetota bacterium]